MVEARRSGERGNATVKFLLVLIVIGCTAYAAYLYIPVAVQSYQIKDLMQHNVDLAAAQGYKPQWVSEQIAKSAEQVGIPANAQILVSQKDNRIEARVSFKRPIEFPGYVYDYEFDHTATSTAFLTLK